MVPNRETRELRLRVTAVMKAGTESDLPSAPVSVRATVRPSIAQARALYDRARVLAAQQRTAEARLKYEEALAAWDAFGEVLNDLGKLHADLREPAKALEYFLRARQTCPSSPTPYVNAAAMEHRLGLYEDALADLRDAVALGVDMDERTAVLAGEILWKLAALSGKAENWDRTAEACRLILRIRLCSRTTRARAEVELDRLKSR
jgi:tetratricopeptide (TPR) repeat protein